MLSSMAATLYLFFARPVQLVTCGWHVDCDTVKLSVDSSDARKHLLNIPDNGAIQVLKKFHSFSNKLWQKTYYHLHIPSHLPLDTIVGIEKFVQWLLMCTVNGNVFQVRWSGTSSDCFLILSLSNLTFRGPCIVIYSCNKTNEMH
jgi:hypothetical protein